MFLAPGTVIIKTILKTRFKFLGTHLPRSLICSQKGALSRFIEIRNFPGLQRNLVNCASPRKWVLTGRLLLMTPINPGELPTTANIGPNSPIK